MKYIVANMRILESELAKNCKLAEFDQKRCKCGIMIDVKDDECEYCKGMKT